MLTEAGFKSWLILDVQMSTFCKYQKILQDMLENFLQKDTELMQNIFGE